MLRNRGVGVLGTFAERVPGQELFTKDLNCHCFDPNKEFVLNPNAWADPPAGSFGTGAPYYNDYRQQRRPIESMGLGRLFHIAERKTLQVRMEFSNVFNRAYLNNPDSTNAKLTQTTNTATGQTISGFGRINAAVAFSNFLPRTGTFVARFNF